MTDFKNETAEKCAIAAFVTDGRACRNIPELTEADFQSPACRAIFATMRRLHAEKSPIDIVTTSDALEADHGKQKGGELYAALIEIARDYKVAARSMLDTHIKSIRSHTARRRLVRAIETAYAEATDPECETSLVIDRARQALRDIVNTKHNWTDMFTLLSNTTDCIEKRYKGELRDMPTGIRQLDKIINGLRRGEMTIIGARPGVGKSAFAGEIAVNLAKNGHKVGIVSREMSPTQYGMRLYSSAAHIHGNTLRTGALSEDDWGALADALVLYSRYPVSFMFTTRYVEDVRVEAQKKVDSGEMDVLIIDYVQLLQTQSKFEKDYLRVGYISKALKDMAMDLNIAVVALAQVGRAADADMPQLSELRGSGDLEQDADNVIFLYSPKDAKDDYVYPDDRQAFDKWSELGYRYMAINVAKQRQGETKGAVMLFDPAHMFYMPIKRS